MSQEDNTWEDYYQKTKGRAPRPLLLDVLEKFPRERCGLKPFLKAQAR